MALEKKVLVIDADPQANATSGLGATPLSPDKTVYNCMLGGPIPKECLVETSVEGLMILPSRSDLSGAVSWYPFRIGSW